MHVLIIPSWYPRHIEDVSGSFFREQALAVQKSKCKVGVIYPELRSLREWRSAFSKKRGIHSERDSGVPTYRSRGMNWFPRLDRLASKLFIRHGHRLYKRYVAENGIPDVIHVHSLLYAGVLANEIFERYKIPFIVTEHSTAFARKLISPAGISLAKAASLNASRRFAVSEAFANLLNELLGHKGSPWMELPNIVNEKFLQANLEQERKPSEFRFVNVAFMNEKKKQSHILRAFSHIKKAYSEARLTLAGDGPERKNLERLAVELGIHEAVKFTGLLTRDQVLIEIVRSDAFVLASSHETFGVVVIEALALGKPVIATRCGGPESILREKDGILIPVDDVDALTDAMSQMILSRGNYDSAEIRNACALRFSEAAVVSRLMKTYEETASNAASSSFC
jgi:glycosyltransferase involved in cell wall biosynthesis